MWVSKKTAKNLIKAILDEYSIDWGTVATTGIISSGSAGYISRSQYNYVITTDNYSNARVSIQEDIPDCADGDM